MKRLFNSCLHNKRIGLQIVIEYSCARYQIKVINKYNEGMGPFSLPNSYGDSGKTHTMRSDLKEAIFTYWLLIYLSSETLSCSAHTKCSPSWWQWRRGRAPITISFPTLELGALVPLAESSQNSFSLSYSLFLSLYVFKEVLAQSWMWQIL